MPIRLITLKLILFGLVFCVSVCQVYGLTGFTFNQDTYNKVWNDETEIWFGQSTALSGQTRELGYPMMTGVQAAFKEINENNGGVWGGKKLRLVTLDDGYEPARTVNNTIQLINNNTIFALIGYMGTGTSQAALGYITESKLPFIGAFTGGLFLRSPFISNIINIRASYQDETVAMVDYLVTVKMVRRIAIFYQNDAFGMSGVDGSTLALTALGMSLVSRGSYERNTIVVQKAVSDIVVGRPQAIICMSTYKPTVEFINAVKNRTDYDSNIIFMTGSFIGSNILPYRDSIVITQVLPPPTNTKYPIVLAYQRAMKASNPNYVPSYVELEGYIAGKMAANILTQRVSGDLTRSNFLQLVYGTSTYIIDNQVIGPYKQCFSTRSLPYFIDDPQNRDAYLYPLLQPRTRLIPRSVQSSFVAPCSCNQGFRSIWKTVQKDDSSFVEITDPMVWDTSTDTNYTCFYDPTKTLSPIVFGHITSGDKYDEDFLIGVMLVFNEKNSQKGIRGRVLRILTKTPSNYSTPALIEAVSGLKEDYNTLGMLGGYAPSSNFDQFVDQIKVQLPNTVFLSPSTSHDLPSLRSQFVPNVIHMGLTLREKLATFFDFELNMNGHSRFSVVYGQSTYGVAGLQELKNQLTQFGLSIESECEYSSSMTDYNLITQALTSDDSNPQSVIVLLPENNSSFSYLSNVIKGIVNIGKRDDLSIFLLYFRYLSWGTEIVNLMATLNTKNKLYLIQRYPHVVNNQLPLIAAYNSLMSKYYSDHSVSTTGALYGFLSASFLIEVMENISPSLDISGDSIISTIYQNQQFLKYSIPFGNFVNNYCNVGMRTTYLYLLEGSTFSNVKIQSFDKTKCGLSSDILASESTIEKQLLFGRLLPLEETKATNDDFLAGITALFTSYNTKGTLGTATLHLETLYYSSKDDMFKKAEELITKYKIFGFLGSKLVYDVTELKELLGKYKIPIIGPISSQVVLREPYSRYLINLRPSIVEESVSLTRYLRKISSSQKPNVLLLYGASNYWKQNRDNVISFYAKSIEEISILSASISSISSQRSVEGTSQPDMVLLFASTDEVSQFLKKFPSYSNLFGIPSEISSTANFKSILSTVSSSDIISPQFLEQFDKASQTNFMAKDFIVDMEKYSNGNANLSMLTYEAYAVGYMATSVLKFLSQVNMDYSRTNFVDTLFERSVFELGSDEFGPYGDDCSRQDTIALASSCMSTKVCNCSQGVRSIRVDSLTSSNSNTSFSISFQTCGLKPIEPLLSDGAIAGVAVGGALLVAGIIFLILLVVFCERNRSSVKNAPKSGNITCAFTDVQNSTKLWQHNEKAMRAALEIHDKIMRKNLELFRGYEVKTNGDSFFVAFKDSFDAVLWALTVQLDLLIANWPSELYQEFDCRQEWDERTKRPYWSGLRVRIGLHYGKGDCKWDKTMKRFDFFGTVVNKSARIEALAHGGQVLISEELLDATQDLFQDIKRLENIDFPNYQTTTKEERKPIEDAEKSHSKSHSSLKHQGSLHSVFGRRRTKVLIDRTFTASDLGVYPLKGLSESSRLFEIKTPEIRRREYPPLRVDQGELTRLDTSQLKQESASGRDLLASIQMQSSTYNVNASLVAESLVEPFKDSE